MLKVDTAAAAVLDPASLQRLQALDPSGGGGFLLRLLSTYAASLDKLGEQAAAAAAAADPSALAKVAHTLKSSSASVGALDLARRCEALERTLRAGPVAWADIDVDGLLAEVGRVREAVSAVWSGLAP